MKVIIQRLYNEPVLFLTGLGVAGTAVIGAVMDPPTWLVVGAVAVQALAGLFTRSAVKPTDTHATRIVGNDN